MSLNKKHIKTVSEAVGDTSGFNDKAPAFNKTRKITLFAGLGGILVLVIIAVIFLATPNQVEFKFQDTSNKPAERYIVSKDTSLLENAPKDPTNTHYVFSGWYLNTNYTGDALFNNDKDDSLLKFKFTDKNTVLYAKWVPYEYAITYDVKGNGNFNASRVEELEKQNLGINPSTYTFSHIPTDFEQQQYAEKLRQEDPAKYNNHDALLAQLEIFISNSQLKELPLKALTVKGWTFEGWYDEDGNKVEKLDRYAPRDITLVAKWSQN
ncbi:MAG: InlB B-repeat-containing protein [Bacilli bacterium]|nr:InlB B-repeat-containing protein [Bacilli bacterium]